MRSGLVGGRTMTIVPSASIGSSTAKPCAVQIAQPSEVHNGRTGAGQVGDLRGEVVGIGEVDLAGDRDDRPAGVGLGRPAQGVVGRCHEVAPWRAVDVFEGRR